jgi:hypothetical protein
MTEAIENMDNLLEMIQLLINGGVSAAKHEHASGKAASYCDSGMNVAVKTRAHRASCAPVVDHVVMPSGRKFGVSRSSKDNAPYWEKHAPINKMALPDIFDMLRVEDAECVVCVRRIHKLGFKSVKCIKQFFSLFGGIRKVIVLPSRQKDLTDNTNVTGVPPPVRPSSMCFLVMDCRESAYKILEQSTYYIGPWPVEVSYFDPNQSNSVKKNVSTWERSPSVSSIDTMSSY